jgi:hypothetical protein
VTEGSQEIRGATGHLPTFYLPSRGALNPAAYIAATSAHQQGVVGTLWVRSNKGALANLKTGEIVILDLTHATPERAQVILSKLLDRAGARGFRIVDLASAHVGVDQAP